MPKYSVSYGCEEWQFSEVDCDSKQDAIDFIEDIKNGKYDFGLYPATFAKLENMDTGKTEYSWSLEGENA